LVGWFVVWLVGSWLVNWFFGWLVCRWLLVGWLVNVIVDIQSDRHFKLRMDLRSVIKIPESISGIRFETPSSKLQFPFQCSFSK